MEEPRPSLSNMAVSWRYLSSKIPESPHGSAYEIAALLLGAAFDTKALVGSPKSEATPDPALLFESSDLTSVSRLTDFGEDCSEDTGREAADSSFTLVVVVELVLVVMAAGDGGGSSRLKFPFATNAAARRSLVPSADATTDKSKDDDDAEPSAAAAAAAAAADGAMDTFRE